MKMKIIFAWMLIVFLFSALKIQAQIILEQDIIRGGVTYAGFSTGMGAGDGMVSIYVEPGSTIKRAYLLTYSTGFPAPDTLMLDSVPYIFNEDDMIAEFEGQSIHYTPIRVYLKDITQNIYPFQLDYEVTVPKQLGMPFDAFRTIHLIVIYENPEMAPTSYSIYINNQDLTNNNVHEVLSLNPVNTNFDVGFALMTDRARYSVITDTPYLQVKLNNQLLGIIGGADSVNYQWKGAGVKGHFYYQSSTLSGLDDDVANSSMDRTDGLAEISSLLNNQANSFNFALKDLYSSSTQKTRNILIGAIISHRSNCESYEISATQEINICRGESAQLSVDGGLSYEWQPQVDLSCYDCPNPVFNGEQTRNYTVRVWNTDSCTVVKRVHANVFSTPGQVNMNIVPSTCSKDNGSMALLEVSGGTPYFVFNIGGNNTTNPNFNNLPAGEYTLNLYDQNGCTYSESFLIEEINPVTAAFTANPQNGEVPLNVEFINQSTFANHYQWSFNDYFFDSTNLNFTFDDEGKYPVQLIAWFNEPHCADTVQKVIEVESAFFSIIPTLHSSSQGYWSMQTTNFIHAKVQIYNDIGQLIHQSEQSLSNGSNPIWNTSKNAFGYYVFRVKLTDIEGKEHNKTGKVLVVR
jgi:hypothetical protein